METTAALLLRKTKLTETSLIVTWLTASHGRIKTVAKGARQPKSRFAGRLDLFFECEIQFARSARSELHPLRELTLCNAFEGLRREYPRVRLAAYFVELIELVTELDHPAPELHDLLRRAFTHLNAHSASQRALLHFETELARNLGIFDGSLPAATALGRAYHHLPRERPELFKSLPTRMPPEDHPQA